MKILILTCSPNGTASRCLPELRNSEKVEVMCVILANEASPKGKNFFMGKIRKMLKIGLLGAINGVRIRRWYADHDSRNLGVICRESNVPLLETDFINSDHTRQLFRDSGADLGISLGNGYIAESVFSIPKYGMINVHGEILPDYQNAQSIIWPIYNMSEYTGLTIHQIDRRIDHGQILYQEKYLIDFRKTLSETVKSTNAITRERVPVAVTLVCEQFASLTAKAKPQGKGGKFTTPSLSQFLRMVRNNTALLKKSL